MRRDFFPDDATADVAVILGYALRRSANSVLWPRRALQHGQHWLCEQVRMYMRRDGTPTPTLEQRVEAGVELFDSSRVDYLLFSGGHPGVSLCSSS